MFTKQKLLQQVELVSATLVRKNISEIINEIIYRNRSFAIGRRNKIEALIIKYPQYFNEDLSAITNYNANSDSFKFLVDEPNLYSINDLRKKYVQ